MNSFLDEKLILAGECLWVYGCLIIGTCFHEHKLRKLYHFVTTDNDSDYLKLKNYQTIPIFNLSALIFNQIFIFRRPDFAITKGISPFKLVPSFSC